MLGMRIKALRNSKHLTQSQLAQALNVSKNAVYAWEAEIRKPEMDKLLELSDFFNVSLDYLVGRSVNPGTSGVPEPTIVAAHPTEGMPPVSSEEMQEIIKKAYLLIMQEEMKNKKE